MWDWSPDPLLSHEPIQDRLECRTQEPLLSFFYFSFLLVCNFISSHPHLTLHTLRTNRYFFHAVPWACDALALPSVSRQPPCSGRASHRKASNALWGCSAQPRHSPHGIPASLLGLSSHWSVSPVIGLSVITMSPHQNEPWHPGDSRPQLVT